MAPLGRSNQSTQKRTWLRSGCQSTYFSRHLCNVCGMKRSYAEVAQPALTAPTSPGAPPAAAVTAASPTDSADPTAAHAAPTKAQIVASIKRMEFAMASMDGPEFDMMRTSLLAQIDAAKLRIIETKPIGVRVASARAALEFLKTT